MGVSPVRGRECRLESAGDAIVAVQTEEQVLTLIRDHQSQLQAIGIRRLGLFGSFRRGEQHASSDVDVLVEFVPRSKTFDNFMQAAFFLEQLFDRRVELVTAESLSPYLAPHILSEVQYVAIDPAEAGESR
jgi:predicted nucleotidyltransferase